MRITLTRPTAVVCSALGLVAGLTMSMKAQVPPQAPGAPPRPSGQGAPATTGTGVLSGVVVDAMTGAPVAGASVALGRLDVTRPAPRMVTDSKGRFVFSSLPPSDSYYLDARRFGYASTRYGWSGPDGSSLIRDILRISVADGQWLSTIKIPLWRFATVSGRVLDERGEPMVGVVVRAFGLGSVAGRPQMVGGPLSTTDDRGAYRLTGLQPGRHIVSVLSVQSTVLNTTPETPAPRAVGELQTSGVSMGNGSFVSAPGIDIDGRHRLVMTNFGTPPPPANGQTRAYPAVFYPAALLSRDATPIELTYGDNRSGIDFQLTPIKGVRVSGRLETRGSAQLPSALLLRLMPAGSERLGVGSEAATTMMAPDGSFTFLNVPEGNYTLIAQSSIVDIGTSSSSSRLPDPPGYPGGRTAVGSSRGAPGLGYLSRSGQGASIWGRISVGVGAEDVPNVVVPLHAAVKIRGRFAFVSEVPANLILGLDASPADGDLGLGQPRGDATQTADGWTFEVQGLLGGLYLLNAGAVLLATPGVGTQGYTGPLAVVSIVSDGRDVIDTGFDGSFGRDFDDVVITLTTKVAKIDGVVRDANGPSQATVIAFPVERDRWVSFGLEPRRLDTASAGIDGKFLFDDLPQGEYFLIAVDRKHANSWVDPRFLDAASRQATRVAVKWGEQRTLNLTLAEVVVK